MVHLNSVPVDIVRFIRLTDCHTMYWRITRRNQATNLHPISTLGLVNDTLSNSFQLLSSDFTITGTNHNGELTVEIPRDMVTTISDLVTDVTQVTSQTKISGINVAIDNNGNSNSAIGSDSLLLDYKGPGKGNPYNKKNGSYITYLNQLD